MSAIRARADASAEALMGEIVDDFLERLGRGERPEAEEYARTYPQLAAEVRQLLPALGAVHGSDGARPESDVLPANPLGDFRVVREVGRGGMGVVYEAVQLSLGRRVALKVLPFAATLDPRQLQRFILEAQAAAILHHPHIVPVYAVGCERGVHYYAMQLVEGRNLAELIADLRLQIADCKTRNPEEICNLQSQICNPTPLALSTERSARDPGRFRGVARLVRQAAEALEYAHQMGIVHRDVKPANLLVDGRGDVWVTDFGLARVRSGQRLTAPGDAVGTLRYMSPEQALGLPAGVDHRADVYALGATLYELLTLRPAFDGRDRQELLRQIAQAEPVPPRRLDRAVPAELETVVLKALARDPAERYPTARELADDLGNFLDDRPVRARRPTWPQQARRWARRHRPVVWSGALALLATLAVVAGSVGWVLRDRATRQARADADLEAAVTQAEQYRREGLWPQAQAAAGRAALLLRDGATRLDLAPRVAGLLRDLERDAADVHLLARLDAIRLLQTEVNVRASRFRLERALPEYRQAFTEYGAGTESAPEEAAALLCGRPAAVRAAAAAALDHWLILAHHAHAPEVRWLEQTFFATETDPWRRAVWLARARRDRPELERLARTVDVATQPPTALSVLEGSLRWLGAEAEALALLGRARAAHPGDFWMNHDLGMALQACRPPRYDEAVRYLTAAVALRPESAGARLNLGAALFDAGRLDEAAEVFRETTALRPDYATAHASFGLTQQRLGRLDEAVAAFRRALELTPDDARAHYNLGIPLAALGRLTEAAAAYRRALELEPDLAEAHCNLGIVLRRQGDFAGALAELRRGHELGSRRPDWPYPTARLVRECERLLEGATASAAP